MNTTFTSNNNNCGGKVFGNSNTEYDFSGQSNKPGCALVIVLALVAAVLIHFVLPLL